MRNRTLLAIALTALSGVALAQTSADTPPDQQNSTPSAATEPVPVVPAPPQVAPPPPPQIPEAAAANPLPAPSTTTVTTTVTAPGATITTAPNAPAITDAASANGDKGLKTASVASVGVQFVAVQPAYVMSSNLIGTNVYNNQNEALGAIRDLVIDSNKITGIIVNVSGFLGLGESYVVIDPATVTLAQQAGVWKAYIDTSKDNLKSAPKFTYGKKPS